MKSFDKGDFEFSSITPSPSEEIGLLDPETGALIFPEREKLMPAPEELPYAPEQWYVFYKLVLFQCSLTIDRGGNRREK